MELTHDKDSIQIQENKARLTKMLKALGNPIRFQILETLAERKTCITNDIVETTTLAQSTVSQHLKVLREAGLISGEIDGPATCYCIDPEGILFLKKQIEGWLPNFCAPIQFGFLSENRPDSCC